MQRRILSSLLALLCVTYLTTGVAFAANKSLSLVSSTGQSTVSVNEGVPATVEVRINDASLVAGASFTVTYDTAHVSLSSITSAFFGTFVSQGIPTPLDQGYVTIDGTKYWTPLVINKNVSGLGGTVPTGSMLAAARVNNGSGTNVKLFVLKFTLIGNPGTYPVSIKQSKISNTDAGYSASGDLIPFLVGIGSAGTYPAHSVATINNASIQFKLVDVDGDNISDLWENKNAPQGTANPLAVFSKTGDYDKDGYSDYVEYINRFLLDPLGNPYDPEVVNAPDGPGYVTPSSGAAAVLPATLYMMLDWEN